MAWASYRVGMAFDDATAERLARRTHERYLDDEVRSGRSIDGDGARRPWDELPEDFKLSSRAQVQDIIGKLDSIGCYVRPIEGTGKALAALPERDVELLAQREHERWCAERKSRGWRSGPARDDLH